MSLYPLSLFDVSLAVLTSPPCRHDPVSYRHTAFESTNIFSHVFAVGVERGFLVSNYKL